MSIQNKIIIQTHKVLDKLIFISFALILLASFIYLINHGLEPFNKLDSNFNFTIKVFSYQSFLELKLAMLGFYLLIGVQISRLILIGLNFYFENNYKYSVLVIIVVGLLIGSLSKMF
ncbi:MAG: hypothetical protein JWM09_398 [Francisellaceae bacterium]|nr:hypothetical protein [Francisellaceae bacterium]